MRPYATLIRVFATPDKVNSSHMTESAARVRAERVTRDMARKGVSNVYCVPAKLVGNQYVEITTEEILWEPEF